jgi:hypothetical protein
MEPQQVKLSKFFYTLAIISCLGSVWSMIITDWPDIGHTFFYPASHLGIYFIAITWMGVLTDLCALAGGLLAFRVPKIAWFFLMGGAMGNSFFFFRFINALQKVWVNYWLFPLPAEKGSGFGTFYMSVFFTMLSFIMMFFIFFSRAGKGIKPYKKIIFVSLITSLFILLYLLRPGLAFDKN